jgi:hypothetical protein
MMTETTLGVRRVGNISSLVHHVVNVYFITAKHKVLPNYLIK